MRQVWGKITMLKTFDFFLQYDRKILWITGDCMDFLDKDGIVLIQFKE